MFLFFILRVKIGFVLLVTVFTLFSMQDGMFNSPNLIRKMPQRAMNLILTSLFPRTYAKIFFA